MSSPASSPAAPLALAPTRPRSYLSRRILSGLGWTFCVCAFVLVAVPLADIVIVILRRGLAALTPAIFTEVTTGISGGLANAIEGTLLLSGGALLIGVPVGIGAAIYLSEFGRGFYGDLARFLADVLTGVPSIVLGYFAYVTMVEGLGWQFSLLAGAITLAIMVVPYLARIAELALRQTPNELREATYALGAPERVVVMRVLLPIAWPGILTGILLSLAISVGETAPLIYSAGWSNYMWSGRFTHEPVGYLTYVIWTFINQPFASAHALAFAAALLVMAVVLAINVTVRLLLRGHAPP
jgi:phosphate transport system permease protein